MAPDRASGLDRYRLTGGATPVGNARRRGSCGGTVVVPHRGYGAGAASLLRRLAAGAQWPTVADEQFGAQGSYGNGSAMCVAPIGLLAVGDPLAAAELARRSARVTHTHPLGVEGGGRAGGHRRRPRRLAGDRAAEG